MPEDHPIGHVTVRSVPDWEVDVAMRTLQVITSITDGSDIQATVTAAEDRADEARTISSVAVAVGIAAVAVAAWALVTGRRGGPPIRRSGGTRAGRCRPRAWRRRSAPP